jgi:HD-like signal output (HDOD) protein
MADSRVIGKGKVLLDALRHHPQLPGLGTAISKIVAVVDADSDSIQELRNVILADVHLTQRILAIANSVVYRQSQGGGVTTVTRAIVVIGFAQIKLVALGMVFVDQMPEKDRAAALKAELIQGLQASLLAREMSRNLAPEAQEKAAIAALLGNVARLVLVMIDLQRVAEIARQTSSGVSEEKAAENVLGMSLQTLTAEVLSLWAIPQSLAALSMSSDTHAEGRSAARLERIVALAKTTARHLRESQPARRDALLAEVRTQCIADGILSEEAFDRWVEHADAQMAPLRAMLEAVLPDPAPSEDGFPVGTVIGASTPTTGPLDAVGKPANCRELVLSRLQDLTDLITERQGLSAILLTALECLHTGFGYSRSVLLLRDAGTSKLRARVWCGAITKAQAMLLELDLDAPNDLFATAIRRGSDLQIQDTRVPAIAARLPPYLIKACPQTASFILLPILAGNSALACILVGRDVPEPQPIDSTDVRLLRTVRGQIVLAMKTIR